MSQTGALEYRRDQEEDRLWRQERDRIRDEQFELEERAAAEGHGLTLEAFRARRWRSANGRSSFIALTAEKRAGNLPAHYDQALCAVLGENWADITRFPSAD